MEVPLQQRIVGAIVLVTLGVIFIPALLDGSGYKSRQVQDIEVKEKPTFPPLTQRKVKPIATPIEKIKKEQTKQAAKQTATNSKKPHKKTIKSFALQVGTFDDNANAKKMRNKLRKAGYTTFVVKSKSKGKIIYKVRIGPELERKKLEKINKNLKKSQKIEGFVVNHP